MTVREVTYYQVVCDHGTEPVRAAVCDALNVTITDAPRSTP